MTFEDHFSAFAPDYARARPVYPLALYAFLIEQLSARQTAWDCATGSGQCAIGLTPYFERVIATDASPDMIAHAIPHPKVEYAVAPAENAPIADESIDLITVAQAIHWFDLDRFYAEANRVLRPGGVLAYWGYAQTHFTPEIGAVLTRLNNEFLKPYWAPQIRTVNQEGYLNLRFPFEEIPAPEIRMETHWDLSTFLDYLGTWSAMQAYRKAREEDPLQTLLPEFQRAWGEETTKTGNWELFIRVGRKL
ncbi:MAG: methyltransferase domain-containing protein [Fimbriimonadia bacterium]|nr:methyltransferase domain-containing protein [Fimbriimonadia bacterium]